MCVLSYLKVSSPSLSFSLCSCIHVCVHMLMCMPSCMRVDLVYLCKKNVVCSERLTYGKVKVGSRYAADTVSERKYSFTSQTLFLKLKVLAY